ncbi:hypothetical protein FG379_002564 [Cryptosporidium bovis]|uniref:uncharacterized protein n=1 Tax=Cryptosporidium bovis TaxID=310047 RepID=UPI00351A987D|nr:hypothetical protein FG379_002564 [Cryptosporidium bovis]
MQMVSNFYDEEIRNTIKSLHKKLLKLFYLENQKTFELLNEINNSISESSEYGISQCIDIIIPPIVMVIHKYIKNDNYSKLNKGNSKESHQECSSNSVNTTLLEELFKILYNVLFKINSGDNIVSNRISMIFYDILFPITQTFRICKIQKNESLINLLIKIVNQDLRLFWRYWKYDLSDPKGQYLIIPVMINYFLSISLPLPNENKVHSNYVLYSKNNRKTSLETISKIPNIIDNNEILIKIFPGVIQAVSLQILNIDIDNTPFEIIDLSLKTFIEWFSYCISDNNTKQISSQTIISSTINTGKIIEHILNFKSNDLSLFKSSRNIEKNEHKCKKISTIRRFFIEIANSCLINSFENFIRYSKLTLKRCVDFLFSMCQNAEENSIIKFLKFLNETFSSENSDQKSRFFEEYFSEISTHFQCGIFDRKKLNSYNRVDVCELLNIISRDYGIMFIRNKLNINLNYLDLENMLNSLFESFISNNSFEIYQKNILKLVHIIEKFDTNRPLVCSKENLRIETQNINMEITDVIFSNEIHETKNTFNSDDFLRNISVFQFFGDIITSIFCGKFEEDNIYSFRSLSLFAMDTISILLINLKNEAILCCFNDLFRRKLSDPNNSLFESFTDFLTYFILCYLTEYLINYNMEDHKKPCNFYNKSRDEISQLLTNLLELLMKEFSKTISFNCKTIYSIVNVNILLISIGNIFKIANDVEQNKDVYIQKFNSMIFNLILCFYDRRNITHNNARYVLVQFSTLFGSTNCTDSIIKELLTNYSADILKPIETMLYNKAQREMIEVLLFLFENCQIELLIELEDLVEKIININIEENMWIFEFIHIISYRLSSRLYYKNKQITSELIFEHIKSFTNLKEEINISFRGTGENIRKMIFIFCLEFNVFFRNIINKIICELPNDYYNYEPANGSDKEHFLNESLPKDQNFEMSKIRTIANKLMPISYSFSFNNDNNDFSILKYQHLSVNTLLNCLSILSTDKQNLFLEASRIASHAINSWERVINLFIRSNNNKYRNIVINTREICIINQILIKLIVSCENFIIKKLEENLVPLLLTFIEFIFERSKNCEFMDDKEDRLNSTMYILSIKALDLLKYFTKFYTRQSTSILKFETLNNIVGKFTSPVIGSFSIYWRLVSTEIIIDVFKVFPFLIKTHLETLIVGINDHISTISFITKYMSKSCLQKNYEKVSFMVDLIAATEGESSLISKMNSI